MQFLPSMFENVESSIRSTRSSVTKAYSGLQNAQSGSFSDFVKKEIQERADYDAQQKLQNYYNQNAQKAKEIQTMLSLSDVQNIANSIMEDFEASAYGMNGETSSGFISPYSMYENLDSISEVRFNENEVNDLIASMIEGGYTNQAALAALEEASANLNGSSSEYLMQVATAALIGEEQTLSKLEEQQLLALSQKLMNGTTSGEEMFNSLTSKSPSDALNMLSNAIGEKGSVNLSDDELSALSSMLNLSDAEKNKLAKMLEGIDNVELSKQDFDALMASARQELVQKQKDLVEFNNALSQNLENLEDVARERMEFEASTQNLEDKRTEISRKTMENTQLEEILNDFHVSEFEEQLFVGQVQMLEDVENVELIRDPERLTASGLETSLKSALSLSRDSSENKNDAKQENSSSFSQSFQSSFTEQVGKNSQTVTETSAQRSDSFINQQIEEALANAMKGNKNKIEVELNPVELGALTITLTSKGGEISAQIQSEKLETMHLLNQQIDVIKRELEGQGIKLENIEVDLKSNDSEHFAEQNNGQSNQEESMLQYETMNQQVSELNKLRVLGRGIAEGWVDKSALSEEEYELAQNLLKNEAEDTSLLGSLNDSGQLINTRA